MIVNGNTIKYPNTYSIYCGMVKRCYGKTNRSSSYKERGIKVCDRWLGENGFNNFLLDMGPRPENLSIDRVDNNGNYSPENCRWATPIEQARNRRSTTMVEVNGDKIPLAAACEYYGLQYGTVYSRIKKGMTPEQALTTPLMSLSEAGKKGGKSGFINGFADSGEY